MVLLWSAIVGTIVEHGDVLECRHWCSYGKELLLFGHAFKSGRQRKGGKSGLKG